MHSRPTRTTSSQHKWIECEVPKVGGMLLVCHCQAEEDCHADVLIERFVELHGTGADDDATSDEDWKGRPKARRGAGLRGVGPPVSVSRGSKAREIDDGGGLCSPGRWPPEWRRLPPEAAPFTDAIREVIGDLANEFGEQEPEVGEAAASFSFSLSRLFLSPSLAR